MVKLGKPKLEQLIPTEPEEGQITGSAAGTAAEASAGDAYATAIFDAVRKNFTPPEGLITDAQLARLTTTIKIRVGEDGSILENKLLKSSGNSFFDDACVSAILATRKVPPPPPAARRLAARGYALEFAGKDLK
jgi:TonB family protein